MSKNGGYPKIPTSIYFNGEVMINNPLKVGLSGNNDSKHNDGFGASVLCTTAWLTSKRKRRSLDESGIEPSNTVDQTYTEGMAVIVSLARMKLFEITEWRHPKKYPTPIQKQPRLLSSTMTQICPVAIVSSWQKLGAIRSLQEVSPCSNWQQKQCRVGVRNWPNSGVSSIINNMILYYSKSM